MNISAKTLSVIISFSVLYAFLRVLPSFPMVGISGGYFSAADFITSLYGIILGPYLGVVSIILGIFVSFILGKAPIFVGLDFLPAAVNVFIVGLLIRKKYSYALLLYVGILFVFILHPFTIFSIRISDQLQVPYNWFHMISVILLLSLVYFKKSIALTGNLNLSTFKFMFVVCFIGTSLQHIVGGILFATISTSVTKFIAVEALPAIWTTIFYLYPFERTFIAVISTILSIAIYKRTKILLDNN